MADYGLTIAISSQAISLVFLGILGFFLKRLVSQVDTMDIKAEKIRLVVDKKIANIREDVVRLEANSTNYSVSLTEVKAKLDALSENIQWIREKLAGKC